MELITDLLSHSAVKDLRWRPSTESEIGLMDFLETDIPYFQFELFLNEIAKRGTKSEEGMELLELPMGTKLDAYLERRDEQERVEFFLRRCVV